MATSPALVRQTLGRLLILVLALVCVGSLVDDAMAAPTPRANAASRTTPGTLRIAAARVRQADRTLVSRAKAMRSCQLRHPKRCRAARRKLQRAGLRLARLQQRLAGVARTRSGGGQASGLTQAPLITVSGQTLTWTRVGSVNQYVLVRKLSGQPDAYSLVTGTSITPPPVPGATVRYSVRASVYGSTFAVEKSITYPLPPATVTPLTSTAQLGPFAPDTQAAPLLTANGQTLTWNGLAGVTTYVLVEKVPGRADQYSAVSGTSITPIPVPGVAVRFSIRTAIDGSAWAPEVSITFPAAPAAPSPAQTGGGPVGDLSAPFVKGIVTNLAGWGTGATPQIAAQMSSLGVHWAREDLSWSDVERQQGVFDWSNFDQVVNAAKANGITILPVVGYAPSWTTPDDSSGYAAFVAAAVARYGPGTSANLPWWELWNEPYAPYAWSGHTPNAEAYARDALAAARAAKAAAPSVKLLVAAEYNDSPQTGGSSQWETTWVDDMFTAAPTLGQWINGVAVHPYGGDPSLALQAGSWKDVNGDWSALRIDRIRAQFLAHGVDLPFWATEAGWSTWTVSPAVQAQYYTSLIADLAARPWVRALFPFCLREVSPTPTNDQSQYGLLSFGTWQPKPAFGVLQHGFTQLK